MCATCMRVEREVFFFCMTKIDAKPDDTKYTQPHSHLKSKQYWKLLHDERKVP